VKATAGALLAVFAAGPAFAADPSPALREAAEALARGDRNAAGDAAAAVISDPRKAAIHPDAWALLGDVLTSAELPYAALAAYGQAAKSPTALESRLAAVLALVDTVGDDDALGLPLVGVGADAAPVVQLSIEGAGASAHLLAARTGVRTDRFDRAAEIVARIPRTHERYAEARLLRGIALAQQGSAADAVAALQVAEASVPPDDRALRDLVEVNLARAYYGADEPLKAIEHYVKVSREGDLWIEAHFERAWAHFKVNDMPGTLSILTAYRTPWFEDRYLAEGDMLRTYAMFLMCKFPSAKEELDRFGARYRPLLGELDQTTTAVDARAAFADAAVYVAGGDPRLPDDVWQAFERDERLRDALRASGRAEEELTRLGAVSSPWAERARTALTARRDALVASEGARVLAEATGMRDELRGFLDNADLTRLDIMDYERRLLERAAVTGELDLGDRLGELRALRRRPGSRLWPVQDEVWADEVGYHSVRARSDCREDLL
jgi:tetratricopeptide (TPR) repeat protein